MLEPGQVVVGRYQMVKFLNRGGMADIWTAIDTLSKPQKKIVAFKIMRDPVPAISDRFLREAELHKSLSSPNIVPFYDHGHFEFNGVKFPFCVFPYVAEGRTLEDVIREASPTVDAESGRILGTHIESKRLLDLMIQIATGVKDAHNSTPSVVHRDLKPSNVLVHAVSIGRERAFVTDFGIARLYETTLDSPMPKLTIAGCLGTREYMSPQQAYSPSEDAERDKLRFDPRNDVWSLGVTFYEMITGVLPFPYTGNNDSQIWAEVIAGRTPDPISKYCIGVDLRLVDLVMQCLEYEIEDRPNMDEVLAALNEILFADNSFSSVQPPPHTIPGDRTASSRTMTPSEVQVEIGKAETMANPSAPPARRSTPSGRETLDAPPNYQDLLHDSEPENSRSRVLTAIMTVVILASVGVLGWFAYSQLVLNRVAQPQLSTVVEATSVSSDQPSPEPVASQDVAKIVSATAPNTGVPDHLLIVPASASVSSVASVKPPKNSNSGRKRGYGASPPPTVMYPEIRDNSFH